MTVQRVDITGERIDTPCTSTGPAVWVTVRPNLRRIHVLAGDILGALGKRRDVGGKGRNESEDVTLAAAWLRAHEAEHLVVVEAQRFHPRILASLCTLADRSNVGLWLLHRPPITDATHRAITRRAPAARLLSEVPRPDTPTHQPEALPRRSLGPVPTHDFHVFAAAVRATLDHEQQASTLALHAAAYDRTWNRMGTGTDSVTLVADELVQTLRAAPPEPELLCELRGIQLAAWEHDLHVAVDLDRLLHNEERPRTTPAQAAPALLTYRQPYRAIIWLLAANHVGLDTAASLPLGAVAADGHAVTVEGDQLAVPDALRPALRAQLVLRAGCPVDEPLLPYTAKTLSRALTEITDDLGLATHGRLAERQSSNPQTWLRKLGITIRRLP
jgi:hypothetical protein